MTDKPIRRYWKATTLVVLLALGVVYSQHIMTFTITGNWPRSYVERLDSPIPVKGWQHDGLLLADGRTLQLPGFTRLPEASEALKRATQRGVEITPGGRVIGLIRIRQECGNCWKPNDLRRVDLAHLLEFMREGEFEREIHEFDREPYRPGGVFNKIGWTSSEYGAYRSFVEGRRPFRTDEA